MKTLFLIDGAAGTGKTDLVEYIQQKHARRDSIFILPKLTTREHRSEETARDLSIDLTFVSREDFDQNRQASSGFYWYEYGNELYGFAKSDLDKALDTYELVFVIVRDRRTIQQLADDYPEIRIVPVFIYSDRNEVVKRLNKDGYDKGAIAFRLGRQKLVIDDYLKHSEIYKEVIVNTSIKRDFQLLIDVLVKKYATEPHNVLALSPRSTFRLWAPLVGYKDGMKKRLKQYPFEKNVFVMMKFRPSNDEIFVFIREQLQKSGLNCVRADDPEWNITGNVHNPIAVLHCCKYGIALFNEPEKHNHFSPNVAYELGMMHLQDKKCLILRQSHLDALPFDLVKDLHKTYERELELRQIVVDWLKEVGTTT